MEMLAIEITMRSMRSIFAGLDKTAMQEFAHAALTRPYSGQKWYYLCWNPENPGTRNFTKQIVTQKRLDQMFVYAKPVDPEMWFSVLLKEKKEAAT